MTSCTNKARKKILKTERNKYLNELHELKKVNKDEISHTYKFNVT